ncbi:Dolichyl-phosphate-mannose-protein mannosyltransferase [Neorhodopirellula lusitana]|uniref:Dolichyl-phosphate-mannose-protein mannosyltransferase n=1 Tax=Neorhodopirellula lusitana TaxID=445327 RepID=A0ABY1PU58_9BACT|nr:glycosyltransferase family 39 protein [Neorhodopirellula lusitana]SMP46121.1 Dolichyl-phosphate-mannose-protein mannosyltransferase [Neorhodopirellula lusitana]
MTQRTSFWTSIAIILFAMVVRGGVLVARVDGLSDDPDAYRVIATTLAKTGVLGLPVGDEGAAPTAFRPPLYPWLLSLQVDSVGQLKNSSVAILHWLLGCLTVWFSYDIARRLFSDRVAVVTGILVTLDPILLWQSTLVMTETLAAALTMAVCWWWVNRYHHDAQSKPACQVSATSHLQSSAVLGLLLGLAFLCRPTFLVWAGLLIPAVLFVGPACRVRRGVSFAVAGIVFASIVGAWTLRNLSAIGHPIWATSHGGYTLLLGNNDSFYDYLKDRPLAAPWNSPAWDAEPFFADYAKRQSQPDEVADDAAAYERAKSTIQNRPDEFVHSCWVRLGRLWQPFPHATPGRSTASIVAVGLFYVIVDAMILFVLFHHRRALSLRYGRRMIIAWPAIALVITLSGVHSIYWSNPRMRAPANPVLAIVAATAFLSLKNFSCKDLNATTAAAPD